MSGTFDYILDKIDAADFSHTPFRHIEIKNFLSPEHFREIVSAPQIDTTGARDTAELIETLLGLGYRIITFPGCVTSKEDYLEWFAGQSTKKIHAATEGFGMVFRLVPPAGSFLEEFDTFFKSDALCELAYRKFGLSGAYYKDTGIQKYLHGYEISPHPDIRKKALTWMLNINPGADAERMNFHTHYVAFRPAWSFIQEFWRNNPDVERCWVPWDWCETRKQQVENNSIVFFAPSDDTMHAVRADYDHLPTQRTQYYGNLWYESVEGISYRPEFKSFLIKEGNDVSMRSRVRQTWVGTQLAKAKRRLERVSG